MNINENSLKDNANTIRVEATTDGATITGDLIVDNGNSISELRTGLHIPNSKHIRH